MERIIISTNRRYYPSLSLARRYVDDGGDDVDDSLSSVIKLLL